jgi:alpha-soluble NSF attachment protein
MPPAGVRDRLERYKELDVAFDGSREAKLVEALADAAEEGDADAFTAAVAEFDALTRLDALKTALLLRAKRRLGEAGGDGGEEDLT